MALDLTCTLFNAAASRKTPPAVEFMPEFEQSVTMLQAVLKPDLLKSKGGCSDTWVREIGQDCEHGQGVADCTGHGSWASMS